LVARSKNRRTPGLARPQRLISLMTLVSIKYNWCLARIVYPLEISVFADIGHAHEQSDELAVFQPMQCILDNSQVLGFGTAAVSRRLALQRLDQPFVYTSYQEICHIASHSHIATHDSNVPAIRHPGRTASPSCARPASCS